MKKEIPIRFEEESEQIHTTDITGETVKESHKSKDKVINTGIGTIIGTAFGIFLVGFIGGLYLFNLFVDNGLQENFTIIKQKTLENQQITRQIGVLKGKMVSNNWTIQKAKDTIKNKYNISIK